MLNRHDPEHRLLEDDARQMAEEETRDLRAQACRLAAEALTWYYRHDSLPLELDAEAAALAAMTAAATTLASHLSGSIADQITDCLDNGDENGWDEPEQVIDLLISLGTARP